ncbi:MAG TPA: hypothetical protein VN875_16785 [Candidatus Binatus sp.]|nr:hypothetical protein [Candidatus Binatus sp.]
MKCPVGMIAKALVLFCVSICASPVPAQSTNQPPTQPANPSDQSSPSTAPAQQQPPPASGQQPTQPGQTAQATSKDRLFYTLPNFLTLENAGQVPPLTAKQKFKIVARSSFDYVEFPWYAVLAGISQAEDSEKGYGQGAQGYGKRYGAAFADGTIENFMTSAIFPSILHQDPRFFQSGKGGFWRRTEYAVSRIFITRTDSGNSQFNFSEIVGSAMSAGISTYSYHPHSDQTLSNTASVWGTQVGYDTITLVVKEFWPDIRRKIHKDKTQQQP